MPKNYAVLSDTIVNLESQLDAILNFGESMDSGKKKDSTLKKVAKGAAIGAGVLGAAGAGATYARGRGVTGPVRYGAPGVADTMRKGAAGLRSDASSASAGVRTGRAAVKKTLRKTGVGIAKKAAKYLSSIETITDLSAQVDDILEFKVHDVIGNATTQDRKKSAPKSAISAVGYGTAGVAAGAAGVYAHGKRVTGGNATGKDAMRAGARDISSKAHAAGSAAKAKVSSAGSAMKAKGIAAVSSVKTGVRGVARKVGRKLLFPKK